MYSHHPFQLRSSKSSNVVGIFTKHSMIMIIELIWIDHSIPIFLDISLSSQLSNSAMPVPPPTDLDKCAGTTAMARAATPPATALLKSSRSPRTASEASRPGGSQDSTRPKLDLWRARRLSKTIEEYRSSLTFLLASCPCCEFSCVFF